MEDAQEGVPEGLTAAGRAAVMVGAAMAEEESSVAVKVAGLKGVGARAEEVTVEAREVVARAKEVTVEAREVVVMVVVVKEAEMRAKEVRVVAARAEEVTVVVTVEGSTAGVRVVGLTG